MKHIFYLMLCLFSMEIYGQTQKYTIIISDDRDSIIDYLMISINGMYKYPDKGNHYYVNLAPGIHSIHCNLYGYSLIDTTIVFTSTDNIIRLNTNISRDAFMYEFNSKDFDKIYAGDGDLPIIGLKNDNTFLRKSFFHVSIVGCFQLESGKYSINSDTLILQVTNYEAPCFSTQQKIEHTYKFIIKNGEILNIDKYSGFIEQRYMGHGRKEFDE